MEASLVVLITATIVVLIPTATSCTGSDQLLSHTTDASRKHYRENKHCLCSGRDQDSCLADPVRVAYFSRSTSALEEREETMFEDLGLSTAGCEPGTYNEVRFVE